VLCVCFSPPGRIRHVPSFPTRRSSDLLLAPNWALYPLVALATAAGIIASQALISGAFSLTIQAIQLGYLPRIAVKHTSSRERGRSEEHTSELQSLRHLVCRLLLETKNA